MFISTAGAIAACLPWFRLRGRFGVLAMLAFYATAPGGARAVNPPQVAGRS
jgi:hypothetical protein